MSKFKVLPTSYSALSAFATCPKQFYHLRVAKDIKQVQNEAALWGDTLHKHIEARLSTNTPLPPIVKGYEAVVAPLANAAGGELLVEKKLAVDANLNPVDYKSPEAWIRGIIDVGVVKEKKAILLDWKTGRRKPDTEQLKLFAGLALANYPKLEAVKTGFVWLKENKVDQEVYKRADAPTIWKDFSVKIAKLENAYNTGVWPPKPSGLCRKHCPVPRSKCAFSGTR